LIDFIRKTWIRLHLRGVSFADKSGRLDSLYRVEDPWGMATAREQHRFNATAAIIEKWIGKVDTLLEVGCGEGHQSESLMPLCRALTGIDVSERAVQRARVRCPVATFQAGELSSVQGPGGGRFDLVTACEVLYYMSDVRGAIRRMSELGVHCLATYYDGRAAQLDPVFKDVPVLHSESFSHEDTRWRAVCWRGDDLLAAWAKP
jgi:2-polyprenyl-3-methyl-5-hydroxy-6-metoxy-1,4-benzoquinol methylase